MNKELISAIINTKSDLTVLKETLAFEFTTIPEMEEENYLIVCQKEAFDTIIDGIEIDKSVEVVGVFDYQGNHVIFNEKVKDAEGNDTEVDLVDDTKKEKYKFKIAKYYKKLKPKKIKDENGDVISEEAYTEVEAASVQVNKIFGWADRVLVDEII